MPKLIPGNYLCPSCRQHVAKEKKRITEEREELLTSEQAVSGSPGFSDSNTSRTSSANAVNQLCNSLGLSPAITSSAIKLSKDRRLSSATNKLVKVSEAVASHLSTSLGVPIEPIVVKPPCQNCECLIEKLLAKFKESQSFVERKQLLTFVPESYTIEDTMRAFNCSKYLVVESRKLKERVGILPMVSKKKSGKEISAEIKALLIEFYQENARMCAGAREYVTIIDPNGEKIKKQKMLLLDTIGELRGIFCTENPSVIIGVY